MKLACWLALLVVAGCSVVRRRSNGYRELEDVATESVRRAAPLPPPGRAVAFLEAFLFRDDGRFQLRTLANQERAGRLF